MVALTIVLIPLTATVTWAHQTLFNTTRWEQTVGPLASDPAIINAASNKIVNQIYTAVDPEQKITRGADGAAAAGPEAALGGHRARRADRRRDEGLRHQRGQQGVELAAVPDLLGGRDHQVQQQVVAVLNGDSANIQTVNGEVVLNLVPVLNQVLANMSGTLNSLLGKNITLPTISGNELPVAVCEKISTALGRPVPATCGQIPLFPAS